MGHKIIYYGEKFHVSFLENSDFYPISARWYLPKLCFSVQCNYIFQFDLSSFQIFYTALLLDVSCYVWKVSFNHLSRFLCKVLPWEYQTVAIILFHYNINIIKRAKCGWNFSTCFLKIQICIFILFLTKQNWMTTKAKSTFFSSGGYRIKCKNRKWAWSPVIWTR